MKRKTRNILITGGVILTLICGAAGFGAYKIYSFLTYFGARSEASIPDEIREPRILKGGDFLTKREIFKLEKKGYWTTIYKSISMPDEKEKQKEISAEVAKGIFNFSDIQAFGNNIVAAGEFGAYIFNADGSLNKEIRFEPAMEKTKIAGYEMKNYNRGANEPKIVALDKNNFGFLSIDNGFGGVTVYDGEGKIIWQYGGEDINFSELGKTKEEREENFNKKVRVAGAAVGDLDGDGKSEYLVSRYNDGYHAFDQSGKELWFQPEAKPIRDLKIIDLDGDGKNEIVGFLGLKSEVRDSSGKFLYQLADKYSPEPRYFSGEMLAAEPQSQKTQIRFLDFEENKFRVIDDAGKLIMEADAPLSKVKLKEPITEYDSSYENGSYTKDSESVYAPQAARVKLQKDKPEYLAVVAAFSSDISRANFYVYDANGNLVYHELLPEDAETIAAVPTANQTDEIFIGGKDTIWKFSAK